MKIGEHFQITSSNANAVELAAPGRRGHATRFSNNIEDSAELSALMQLAEANGISDSARRQRIDELRRLYESGLYQPDLPVLSRELTEWMGWWQIPAHELTRDSGSKELVEAGATSATAAYTDNTAATSSGYEADIGRSPVDGARQAGTPDASELTAAEKNAETLRMTYEKRASGKMTRAGERETPLNSPEGTSHDE